jgi:hypothetical protein
VQRAVVAFHPSFDGLSYDLLAGRQVFNRGVFHRGIHAIGRQNADGNRRNCTEKHENEWKFPRKRKFHTVRPSCFRPITRPFAQGYGPKEKGFRKNRGSGVRQ